MLPEHRHQQDRPVRNQICNSKCKENEGIGKSEIASETHSEMGSIQDTSRLASQPQNNQPGWEKVLLTQGFL